MNIATAITISAKTVRAIAVRLSRYLASGNATKFPPALQRGHIYLRLPINAI